MYPKKLELLEREKEYQENTTSWWYNHGIDHMAVEIKKRADEAKLHKIYHEATGEDISMTTAKGLKAISTHITKGLE